MEGHFLFFILYFLKEVEKLREGRKVAVVAVHFPLWKKVELCAEEMSSSRGRIEMSVCSLYVPEKND